jgi:hypothetical protein
MRFQLLQKEARFQNVQIVKLLPHVSKAQIDRPQPSEEKRDNQNPNATKQSQGDSHPPASVARKTTQLQ